MRAEQPSRLLRRIGATVFARRYTAATLESPQLLVEAPGTHSTSSIIFFEEAFTALRRARALYLFSLATCEATAAGVEALGRRRRESSHRSGETF